MCGGAESGFFRLFPFQYGSRHLAIHLLQVPRGSRPANLTAQVFFDSLHSTRRFYYVAVLNAATELHPKSRMDQIPRFREYLDIPNKHNWIAYAVLGPGGQSSDGLLQSLNDGLPFLERCSLLLYRCSVADTQLEDVPQAFRQAAVRQCELTLQGGFRHRLQVQ